MIVNMFIIYSKYLNQANHANKLYNQIENLTLELEQWFQISNNKNSEIITLLELQMVKFNEYKKNWHGSKLSSNEKNLFLRPIQKSTPI